MRLTTCRWRHQWMINESVRHNSHNGVDSLNMIEVRTNSRTLSLDLKTQTVVSTTPESSLENEILLAKRAAGRSLVIAPIKASLSPSTHIPTETQIFRNKLKYVSE